MASQSLQKMSNVYRLSPESVIKYGYASKLHGKVPAKMTLIPVWLSQKERPILGKQEKPMTSAYSAFDMPSLGYSSA
jgi:hypothetical protein